MKSKNWLALTMTLLLTLSAVAGTGFAATEGQDTAAPQYDDLENLICSTYERYLGKDTDGDGDPDCSDPDDDNDLVTDEFEDKYVRGNARLNPDVDGDGIPDGLDLRPTLHGTSGLNIRLNKGTWEDTSADCDDGPGNDHLPDPYIQTLRTYSTSGSHKLPTPPGWGVEYTDGWFSEAPHEDISEATLPTSDVMGSEYFKGSQDITDWMALDPTTNLINNEYPAFALSLFMLDNDEDQDDPIRLQDESTTGVLKIALGAYPGSSAAMYGFGGDCSANVIWSIDDTGVDNRRHVWKGVLVLDGVMAGIGNTGRTIPKE